MANPGRTSRPPVPAEATCPAADSAAGWTGSRHGPRSLMTQLERTLPVWTVAQRFREMKLQILQALAQVKALPKEMVFGGVRG